MLNAAVCTTGRITAAVAALLVISVISDAKMVKHAIHNIGDLISKLLSCSPNQVDRPELCGRRVV